MIKAKAKKGAPLGNHNATKHGFYSSARDLDDSDQLPAATTAAEFDHYVAITRYKLKSVLENDPANVTLIARLLSLQNRLARTRDMLISRRCRKTHNAIERLGRALSITGTNDRVSPGST